MTYIPTATGEWVSEHFERLARIIQDYDPALELRWIPPAQRAIDDTKPFRIIDTRTQSVVFDAAESDGAEGILARLFAGDNTKGDVLRRLDALDAARKALQMKEQMDAAEEAVDKARFLKDSPLHTLKFNGKVFDHNRRVIG